MTFQFTNLNQAIIETCQVRRGWVRYQVVDFMQRAWPEVFMNFHHHNRGCSIFASGLDAQSYNSMVMVFGNNLQSPMNRPAPPVGNATSPAIVLTLDIANMTQNQEKLRMANWLNLQFHDEWSCHALGLCSTARHVVLPSMQHAHVFAETWHDYIMEETCA